MLLNSQPATVLFRLPRHKPSERWESYVDTSQPAVTSKQWSHEEQYELQARSVAVFMLRSGGSPIRSLLHTAHKVPTGNMHLPNVADA